MGVNLIGLFYIQPSPIVTFLRRRYRAVLNIDIRFSCFVGPTGLQLGQIFEDMNGMKLMILK